MNCTNCGAAIELVDSRQYFRCRHCGSYGFPATVESEGLRVSGIRADGPGCPVCASALAHAVLDDEFPVDFCTTCRGVLLPRATFATVINKRRAWATTPPAEPICSTATNCGASSPARRAAAGSRPTRTTVPGMSSSTTARGVTCCGSTSARCARSSTRREAIAAAGTCRGLTTSSSAEGPPGRWTTTRGGGRDGRGTCSNSCSTSGKSYECARLPVERSAVGDILVTVQQMRAPIFEEGGRTCLFYGRGTGRRRRGVDQVPLLRRTVSVSGYSMRPKPDRVGLQRRALTVPRRRSRPRAYTRACQYRRRR